MEARAFAGLKAGVSVAGAGSGGCEKADASNYNERANHIKRRVL